MYFRGVMYDVKFSVAQVMESGVSMSLSAEVYVVTDFTAIATAISTSTEIVSATGWYHKKKTHLLDYPFRDTLNPI